MRKPRDFDAELKALTDKAKTLLSCKRTQLGELVIASGADALPVEQLAGALISAAETKDTATTEVWHKRGAAFFQGKERSAARGPHSRARGASANDGGTHSSAADTRAS